MCIHDRFRTSLDNWTFAFIHGFRYESNKVDEEEKAVFKPFIREQTLTRPCQSEVLQFNNPHCCVFLFFFDQTKPDFLTHTCALKWNELDLVVNMLLKKYSALKIHRIDLRKLIGRCLDIGEDSLYSLDFIRNVCCICFPRDPRNKGTLFPWSFNYVSDPQKLAKIVFNLNLGQSSSYF
jgi:hypothetical protein